MLHIRKAVVYCSNLKCRCSRREGEIPLNDPAAQPEDDPRVQPREVIVDDTMRREDV